MKIFAYGSNMNINRLKERVPSAIKICNASVEGYNFYLIKRAMLMVRQKETYTRLMMLLIKYGALFLKLLKQINRVWMKWKAWGRDIMNSKLICAMTKEMLYGHKFK